MSVRQSKFLIRELLDDGKRSGEFPLVERTDVKVRKFLDKVQELHRAALVIAAKKPAMSLRHDKGRRNQAGRVSEQPSEDRMKAVGSIQSSNQG